MDRVDNAFEAIPRANFLPESVVGLANLDTALYIGYGVTNSQPYTVRLMLEWLDLRAGQKILDVGSGSGWTTGLLAYLTDKKGKVIAVEKIPQLVKFGQSNCEKLGLKNVEFHQASKKLGWPKSAPYDRILVSATASEMPKSLVDQLKNGGRMVIPIKNSIKVVSKDAKGQINQEVHPGFVFVPLK